MESAREPLFGIPNISPYSAGALEISSTAWFAVGDLAKADRIMAVESPIDALSYHSFRVPQRFAGGRQLRRGDRSSRAMLHAHAAAKPSSSLSRTTPQANVAGKRHGTETPDWTGFELSSESPRRKDWNDDLIAGSGAPWRFQIPTKCVSQAMNKRPSQPSSRRLFLAFRGPRRRSQRTRRFSRNLKTARRSGAGHRAGIRAPAA